MKLRWLIPLLFALPAFAAGGSCPTGANYLNTSTNALVTLSSLGITNCYYVAANGSDTNDGLSEVSGHPWAHAPQMPNCASACATVQNQFNGIPPGTGIILRGGDTWHFGQNTGDYTGGEWNFNSGQFPQGTAAHPIYVGVDQSWFSGGSWARPVFTGDNSLCNGSTLGTMPDGATCTGATNTACYTSGQSYFGQQCYYVSACAHQIGTPNNFIEVSGGRNYYFDNFEMTGLCESSVGQPNHENDYFSYGSLSGNVYMINNYLHGASHLQFAGQNGGPQCTASNVCNDISTFLGGTSDPTATFGDVIHNNVIDFSDSDPGGARICFGGFWDVAYNVFRYTTNCGANPIHLFHDNLYEYFFEDGHSNVLESLNDSNGTDAVYNNVFRHIELGNGGGVGIWMLPHTGTTTYVFNNVMYDVGNIEYNNIGSGGQSLGTYIYFNNTFQTNVNQTIMNCNNLIGTLNAVNNHYVDDGTVYATCTGTVTKTTELSMTNATATTDGYTSSQTFAYSPTSNSSPTVGQGTNKNSSYCSALTTAGLTAAAAACQSDTTYACSYAGNGAAPVCPARTVVIHPTGSWDIGDYQFSGTPPVPVATFNTAQLNFLLNATKYTSPGQTVTLTNTGNASLTITSIAMQTGTVFTISQNTCGGSLAINASCAVTVVFTPAKIGPQSDSLIFTDNAANSPQGITVTGTGIVTATPGGMMISEVRP